jgi:iron complex outermembrane receptor protein
MSTSGSQPRWVAGLLVSSLAVPVAAPAADSDTGPAVLEEVVVSARKREENARDVPISFVSMSSRDIEDQGATDLKSLTNSVPNVIIGTSDQDRRQNIVIRGISTVARSIGQETGVAVYLDGVYTGRTETYNQQLADIDRVEFLRGPQGTLFGKNTTAGAISLTTIKPGDQPAGSLSAEFGNFGRIESDGYVSGPLVEGLLYGKVSGFGATSDGYATNAFDGSKAGDQNYGGGRIQLRATPNADLDMTLSADLTRRHNRPYRFEVTTGTFGNIPGPFSFDEAYPSTERTGNSGVALNVDYKLPAGHTLTSITSWRKSDWTDHSDETWNGQHLAFSDYTEHSTYGSQELRIASPFGGPIDYVAGLYYSYQKSSTHTPVSVGDDLAAIFGIPQGWESFDLKSDVTTNGYAAFGNASYHINTSWTLTAGVRYTDEQKHLNFDQRDPNGLGFVPNIGPLSRDYSKSAVTPTASIVYAISPKQNVYATFSSGYKSGGFNVDTLSNANRLSFNPEHVNNYEIGTKGEFLDGRLQADADVFHMDYKDLQVTQYDPASFANFIGNAATARIDGVELDTSALVTKGWSVTARLGYLHTRFTQFIDQYGDNLRGNELTFAPKFSGTLSTEYTLPLTGAVYAFARTEYSYRSSSHADVTNLPEDQLNSFGLLNARLGVSLNHGKWTVEIFGNNLTDRLYAINRTTQLPLLSFLPPYNYEETTTTYGLPRMYGIRLTAKL